MRLSKGLGLFTVMRARVDKNPMPIPQTHLRRACRQEGCLGTKRRPVSTLRFNVELKPDPGVKQTLTVSTYLPMLSRTIGWALTRMYAPTKHTPSWRQDFDPNRKKKITRQQFLSVLGNMNLSLTEREQEAICRRYAWFMTDPSALSGAADCCRLVRK